MLLRIAMLLIAALGTTVQAADGVWKWVDAQGVTHYADRPVPGAVQVDIKVQSYSAPSAGSSNQPRSPETANQPPAAPYRSIEIWRPAADETIINTGGQVTVRVRLDPTLSPRHTIAIYLDGRQFTQLPPGAVDADLTNVPRGTHTAIAAVLNERGTPLQQSAGVTFHVRQESVAQPPVGPTLRPPPKP